jgi:hypothetical protein
LPCVISRRIFFQSILFQMTLNVVSLVLVGGLVIVAGQTQECTTGQLSGCITQSLSQVVNSALANGSMFNFTGPETSGGLSNAKGLASKSPMSFTINECAEMLTEQLSTFTDFKTSSEQIYSDITTTQTALVAVEEVAKDIQSTETSFSVQISQTGGLFANASSRVNELNEWLTGEKVIRNQLSDIYAELDKAVLKTSDDVLLTSSSIRDALLKMQRVHDHATSILTAVGDAETQMYEWAFNVSQAVNRHTVNLVTVAQTLQSRRNQVDSVKDSNTQLNWIVTQLFNKYGADTLAAANKQYEDGNLVTPAGTAQGPNSTSVTGATGAIPTITS